MITKLDSLMYAYVESAEETQKGSFTTWVLHTKTTNGPIKFKFWNLHDKETLPDAGDFLVVSFTDIDSASQEYSKYKDISLDSNSRNKPHFCSCDFVSEQDVPEATRRKIKKDRKAQVALAAKLLQDTDHWKNKEVHAFLLEFMKENLERFTTAPAAISNHHNYRGGLFVHSSEVFANCVGVANAPTSAGKVEADALYLAAWLHDAGKMEIYRMEGDSPRIDSDRESMIGHTAISNQMFLEAAKGRFPKEFVDLVSHCILSHHGRKEWGAPVEPATVEAHILVGCDKISSRMPD